MTCFTPENNAYCLPNVNAFLDTITIVIIIIIIIIISQGKEMARKAPRSEMGGGPAEPAGSLCVAEELPTHTIAGMLELDEQ